MRPRTRSHTPARLNALATTGKTCYSGSSDSNDYLRQHSKQGYLDSMCSSDCRSAKIQTVWGNRRRLQRKPAAVQGQALACGRPRYRPGAAPPARCVIPSEVEGPQPYHTETPRSAVQALACGRRRYRPGDSALRETSGEPQEVIELVLCCHRLPISARAHSSMVTLLDRGGAVWAQKPSPCQSGSEPQISQDRGRRAKREGSRSASKSAGDDHIL